MLAFFKIFGLASLQCRQLNKIIKEVEKSKCGTYERAKIGVKSEL